MSKIDLVKIDAARINETCRLYFLWKDLNTGLRSVVTRGINFPEAISEPMVCYSLDLLWNKGSFGDARDKNNKVVEIKACSNFDRDLTSFSPKMKLEDLIDFNKKKESVFYYTSKKYKFYDILKSEMNNEKSIYQWRRTYVRENKSNLCPTLTANMGTGGHNVPLIKTKLGIRKLTPRECFNLQGFPENYKIPEEISNTQAYKQAGNSVVVPVIERIASEIKKSIDEVAKKDLVLQAN